MYGFTSLQKGTRSSIELMVLASGKQISIFRWLVGEASTVVEYHISKDNLYYLQQQLK